jgi:hypothetical protein
MTATPPEPDSSPPASPGPPVADPDVAATVRLLHRRQGWSRAAVTSLIAFLLAYGADASAESQGAPAPSWFLGMIIVLGALTAVSIIAAVGYSAWLRRRPPAVRAQAAAIAARHPGRPHARHYPPRHLVTWVLRWVGMLLILVVAVVSMPAVADAVAYLAGAGKTVTFDPVSHQTNCDRYSCGTVTDGILETGGAGVSASWQDVVPLGRPFQVREPVWRWAWPGADRQRRDCRHCPCRQPADRGSRHPGSGQPGQAGAQLATAPAAPAPCRTGVSGRRAGSYSPGRWRRAAAVPRSAVSFL